MSSHRQIWPQARLLKRLKLQSTPNPASSACPFCSIAPKAIAPASHHPSRIQDRPRGRTQRQQSNPKRYQSTVASSAAVESNDPRKELEQALRQLQSRAPNFVNLSRLQLALQGLHQPPGDEVIRIAILGVGDGPDDSVKRVLRALLADPLVDEQPWEKELAGCDPARPLILRLRSRPQEETAWTLEKNGPGLNEMTVTSSSLNGIDLELLIMNLELLPTPNQGLSAQDVEDALLSPMVSIPAADGKEAPIATPVHKTLLVADGLTGAVSLAGLPRLVQEKGSTIGAAVNMEGISNDKFSSESFKIMDVALAEKAVEVFRKGPQHGIEYERLWFASNFPALRDWLRSGLKSRDQETKPVVLELVASLLQNSTSAIEAEEARDISRALSIKHLPENSDLRNALDSWAQRAHAELQQELDLAFTGRRWRKLGWWKLFWRVDDVATLTNDMLTQRFLPTTEQELVYLAGRIAGPKGEEVSYQQPATSPEVEQAAMTLASGQQASQISPILPKWPGHITFTRRYLQNETIPALQALAQKLVMQSVGTSGLASSLAVLLYASSLVSTVYSAGAVAALGIVYSLGRMQKKWETAREFWEGEVREEGRKTIKATEESVADVLEGGRAGENGRAAQMEIQQARELLAKAEEAFSRLK